MAFTTLSRGGRRNTDADERELFLELFAGEVLLAFQQSVPILDALSVTTLPHGKQADWPAMGQITASHHIVGNDVIDDDEISQFNHVDRPILFDEEMFSGTFEAKIDQLMNHWDTASAYAKEIAQSIAKLANQYAGIQFIRAARVQTGAAIVNGGVTADQFVPADMAASGLGLGGFVGNVTRNDGAAVYDALLAAAEILDTKDVMGRRVAFLPTDVFYTLVRDGKAFKHEGNPGLMNGSYAQGTLGEAAGFDVISSNQIPAANIVAASPGQKNRYLGDFRDTIGVCGTSDGAGGIVLDTMSIEADYIPEKRGDLITAGMVAGFAPKRPECVVEISSAAVQPAL